MERLKKAKARPAGPMPLSPAAEARLSSQVAGVAAVLESEADLAALREQVTPNAQDPQWDVHLIERLGALSHPAIPALLAALFGEARDRVRRKALKKTLHRLKTRGVEVPEDLLPREEASIGGRRGPAASLVSPIFGNGDSYFILEGPPEILGGNFLIAPINDRTGFQEFVLLNLNRKQQTEFWDHFREQGVEQWFSLPPAYAVARLEKAYTAHPESPGASQYSARREKIFQHWGRPENAPNIDQELPALDPREQTRLREETMKLALDPLFHSWLPGPEEIAPWVVKLREVQNSPLVLSDQQKQVRIDGVLNEATQALYPRETQSQWGRRLLTTAYYLHLAGREQDSRAAQAAAADLAAPDRSSLTGENPFLKALVQYAVHLAWEGQQPRETTTPSGLVAPAGTSLLIRR
jgi:hypothetical protein